MVRGYLGVEVPKNRSFDGIGTSSGTWIGQTGRPLSWKERDLYGNALGAEKWMGLFLLVRNEERLKASGHELATETRKNTEKIKVHETTDRIIHLLADGNQI